MLSTSSDTFLTVDSPDELGKIRFGVGGTKEQRLVLVHTLTISISQGSSPVLTALANSRVSSSKGMTPLDGQKVCSYPGCFWKYSIYVFLTFSADQFCGSGQAAAGVVGTVGAELAAIVAYTRAVGIDILSKGLNVVIRGKKRSNSMHPFSGCYICVLRLESR